jgi:RNA polymerase sigma-70 factor (ECF subfamily)
MNDLSLSSDLTVMGSRSPAAAPNPSPPTGSELSEFEMAIGAYQAELRAFAYRILGSGQDAEDAVQDAFINALRAVQSGAGEVATQRAWLYRVVYRRCIDLLRHRTRRTLHDTLDAADALEAPAAQDLALTRALSRALLDLPVPMRGAVLLVDVHGFDYLEAASALDVPRGTIASRVNQGRATLRKVLEEYKPDGREVPK